MTKEKKCKICELTKSLNEFEKGLEVCRDCKSLEVLVYANKILQEELKKAG